jgi:hypothetical protein
VSALALGLGLVPALALGLGLVPVLVLGLGLGLELEPVLVLAPELVPDSQKLPNSPPITVPAELIVSFYSLIYLLHLKITNPHDYLILS